MRAAVLTGARTLEVTEVPAPGAPPPGYVTVAPTFVGLCGSDLHYFHGDVASVGDEDSAYPRVLGHEFSGVIAAVGADVDRPELVTGARVVALPLEWCGECPSCLAGRGNACYRLRIVGVHRDGALADQVVVPADRVFTTEAPADVAAFTEPLSVSVHALALAGINPVSRAEGTVVVVVGGGAIGQAAVLALTSWGARVAVVDPVADRRETALALGAETAFWAEGEELIAAVREWSGGYGAELVVDSTGAAAVLASSIALARKTATVLVLGLTSAPATILPGALPIDELRIQGSSCATREDFIAAIALVEERVDDVERLITHRYGIDQVLEAFQAAEGGVPGVVKVVIEL